MKSIKKVNSLVTSLLIIATFPLYSMDKPKEKLSTKQRFTKWVTIAGKVILGDSPVQELNQLSKPSDEPFPFTSLPKEIQQRILALLPAVPHAENLESAGRTINILAQTNQYLNQLINDPQFSLQLIKSLSGKFNVDNETVCKYLQTKEAKRLLTTQTTLIHLCENHAPVKEFMNTYQQGADPNFTYKNGMTLVLICSQNNEIPILRFLLHEGASPNLFTQGSRTPLTASVTFDNAQVVESLLEFGADPELADGMGMTPLGAANFRGNNQILNLLHKAVRTRIENYKKLK